MIFITEQAPGTLPQYTLAALVSDSITLGSDLGISPKVTPDHPCTDMFE